MKFKKDISIESSNHIPKFALDSKLKLLFFILFLALVLRLWGNWFGLPYLYHQDETHEVIRALELGAGGFDINRVAKAGYFYLLFFEYGIYFLILKLFGFVKSSSDFALYFIKEPWSFYLIGRTTTALIGVLNVLIAYKIGKEAYSIRAGIIAALFLAINFLHSQSSHYTTVDIPMTCLATLTLMYTIRLARFGNLKNYILAGIFAGLAVQTKATAIVLVFPIIIAHLYAVNAKGATLKNFFLDKTIIIGCTIGLIVLFLGNPGLLVNFEDVLYKFWDSFFGTPEKLGSGPPSMYSPPNLFLFYLYAFSDSMGLPLVIIMFLGVGYGLYRNKKEDILMISFIVSYYFFISMFRDPYLFYYRYIIPILPFSAILCARCIEEFSQKYFKDRAKLVYALTACILIIQPGYKIIRENYLISHKDTRTFAKEWIEENIPAGSRVLIEGMRTKPKEDTVPLQYSRENVLAAIERYREERPGKAKFFELELKVLPEITYDLITVGGHSKLKDLYYYKKIGIEYIVLRADVYVYKRDWLKGRWKGVYNEAGFEIGDFLQKLRNDSGTELLKRFEPNKWNRPGPTIEIYKIKKNVKEKWS